MNIVCDFTLYNLWRAVAVQLPRNSSHSHECLRLVRAVQQAGGPIISINDQPITNTFRLRSSNRDWSITGSGILQLSSLHCHCGCLPQRIFSRKFICFTSGTFTIKYYVNMAEFRNQGKLVHYFPYLYISTHYVWPTIILLYAIGSVNVFGFNCLT